MSPDWFATLGVPLLAGRTFTNADVRGSAKVVVVNQAAAKKFWPNESPVGHIIGVGQGGFDQRAEVIGVVGDVRFRNADDPPEPDVFISYLRRKLERDGLPRVIHTVRGIGYVLRDEP